MKNVKFDIDGMTCSSCSAHVDKAVRKLEGVNDVNVNLLSNSMVVDYDENKITNELIIKAVIDAGYNAIVSEQINNKIQDNVKDMKKRLNISECFLIPLMYIAMHHMLPTPKFIEEIFSNPLVFVFTQLILLIPIVILNRNYFIVGFKRLFKFSPNMDSLIAIGSSSAIIYGFYAIYKIIHGLSIGDIATVEMFSKDVYFESAGTILTLITLGKYLETKSKGKTSDAISKLVNLAPKIATIIKDEKEIQVKTEEIKVGDIVVIRPGGNIPVDGKVIEGQSFIDQSSITGESVPVKKDVGDEVVSGTINKTGYFKMVATKVGKDTTLSQIIKLVEEASNSKAPISKLADKVSFVFVPCVIAIAIIAAIVWLLNGQSFEFALSIAISVLVISCPCALGLATPVAIMVGTGKGAENGILIKSAESLELLHKVDTVVLDKTGTITEGKPEVTNIVCSIEENEFFSIAASLEKNSEHPLAEAILKEVEKRNLTLKEATEFNSVSGRGIRAKINNNEYFVGNIAYIKEQNIKDAEGIIEKSNIYLAEGKTVVYLANTQTIIGAIAIADVIKKTSIKAINELKKKNLDVIMLTGDNSIVAKTISSKVGIDKVIAEVLPQDKEKQVSKLQSEGKVVAFVGDGINDSPALVKADVGIAIGSGTDIAIESADIVLIKNDLLDVVKAICLGKSVINNIKMNLFWAFFYNYVGIPIAAGLLYNSLGIKLNPMIGALAMSLSSVCVVTNALRLRKFKVNFEEEKMNKKEILIDGMQCNHCKMTVEKVLSALDGIEMVQVILEDKKAIVELSKPIENDVIIKAIEQQGFKVKEIR